jgi:apolipoprotein N-acyltransferase
VPRPIGAALFSGILLGLSFPPFSYSFLAWFSLVPLLFYSSDLPRSSFLQGWIAGTLHHLILFSWLWKTFHAAHVGSIQTFFVWLALGAYMGLYSGLFMVGWSKFNNDVWKPLWAAALWVALDFLKTYALTGAPWGLLSQSQVPFLPVIQLASITGAEGITFLIVLVNALVLSIFQKKNRPWDLVAYALVPVLALVFGIIRLLPARALTSDLSVLLLQGNIDPYAKWDKRYEQEIRETYERLSSEAAVSHPNLVLWPESAVPGWYPNENFYEAWVSSTVRKSASANIVGAVSTSLKRDTNSAFLIDESGVLRGRYDKRHLVPFGEYIPFGAFVSRWIPYLGQLGTFASGSKPAVFPVGDFRVAPSICYEMVFPSLIRDDVREGADILVNMTNDGWYLDTGAPEQHLATNILRAVENNRPVFRSANTGVSAVIDGHGRFLFRSKLQQEGAYLVRAPVVENSSLTFFTRAGAWFSYLCIVLTFLGALIYCRPHVTRT